MVGEHVLCVDNEPDILDGMQGLLSRWGALPLVARNCEQAIDGCRRIRDEHGRYPSLLVVDYHLDDGEIGLDIIDAVGAESGRNIPAIVLTADHTEEVATIVRERGYALLNKPVRPAALRAQITSILGRIERP
jgi:DNA-binding response OmpR family regulator